MTDTKYVRLADRLANGCCVDISSGWSIAGLDVVEVPTENTVAQEFVRINLQRGVLEPASRAEFEEVMEQGSRDLLAEAGIEVERHKIEGFYQEAHVVGLADEERRRIMAARGLGGGQLNYKDDVKRRQMLVEAQEQLDDLDDDETLDSVEQPDPVSSVSRNLVGGDPEKSGEDPADVDAATGGKGRSEEGDDTPAAPAAKKTTSKGSKKSKKGAKRT